MGDPPSREIERITKEGVRRVRKKHGGRNRVFGGIISEILSGSNLFEVCLADGSLIYAKRNSLLLRENLKLKPGDRVKVKILFNSPEAIIYFCYSR